MATIIARGEAGDFGFQEIGIDGNPSEILRIVCKDQVFRKKVKRMIQKGEGYIANAYCPPKNTMLQAYATLYRLFKDTDISINGDIGTIPYKPGIVY